MEKKQCSKCKELKNLDCFSKHKKTKDNLNHQCKKCIKIYQKKYHIKNQEKISQRKKEYYQDNKEKYKEYYQGNKENVLKQNKKYREENQKYTIKRNKEYYKDNKEKILRSKKKYRNLLIKFNSKSKYRQDIELYEEVRESKEGYLQCKCAYCGDWFAPTYENISNRLYVISNNNQGEGRLYCSVPCKKSCPTYGKQLYPKGFKLSTSREVQPELRQMVLARDNYTCQRCGKYKDELDVALHCHHLEGIHWEPLMSADIDMCITYCQPCHVKAHQQPDCSYYDQRC